MPLSVRFCCAPFAGLADPTPGRWLRVAVRANGGLASWMAAVGLDVVPWQAADRADVVIAVGRAIGDSDIGRLVSLVERGGGLVVGETAWSWNRHGRPLAAHPANQLCARWGVAWTDGIVEPADPDGFAKSVVNLCHPIDALQVALSADGRADANMRQIEATLMSALRWTPPGGPLFRPRLAAYSRSRVRASFVRPPDLPQ